MIESLIELVQHHEGLRLKPYRDTRGYLTIGYGRCLTTDGISADEAMQLLGHDLNASETALSDQIWFRTLDIPRKAVLVDMVFNLGKHGLWQFTRMLEAVKDRDFAGAAREMLASEWAKQVPARARMDAQIMETGEWPIV